MQSYSRCILGYGLLLVVCDIGATAMHVDVGLGGKALFCGWAGGVAMIAAGFFSAQGRRSLRLAGTYTGLFLPLIFAGMFVWNATVSWRGIAAGSAALQTGILTGVMAILSLLTVGAVSRLRPREGIASRGYAVPIPPPAKPSATATSAQPAKTAPISRSEAG